MPEVLCTQKDVNCEVAICQLHCHRQSIQRSLWKTYITRKWNLIEKKAQTCFNFDLDHLSRAPSTAPMKERSSSHPVYGGLLEFLASKGEGKKRKKNWKETSPKIHLTWGSLFFLYIKLILLRSCLPDISMKCLAFTRMWSLQCDLSLLYQVLTTQMLDFWALLRQTRGPASLYV